MSTLIIVESPGKTKKLSAILGAGYTVAASVGHVRDLPTDGEIGVEPPHFRPKYQPTDRGRDVLKRLKAQIEQATTVLLATDPDREGEAIAWHLADALRLKNPQRIAFHEITAAAVKSALTAPRPIDMSLVRAQEARRVLDRLVGWLASPALSRLAGQTLSAGRVQSPAVRLVVERDRAIAAFKPTNHYGAELLFGSTDAPQWRAVWDTTPYRDPATGLITDQALAASVAATRAVVVTDFADSEQRTPPPPPFTTSTLQQTAEAQLQLSTADTMALAQQLYEQGVITYHRTDNPNLSDEGRAQIAAYAHGAGLPTAATTRTWKAKAGAQEAHEAIRPTHVDDTEVGDTDAAKALYKLIWTRAVASQLEDATYAVRSLTLAGVSPAGASVTFKARGCTLTSQGWKALAAAPEESPAAGDDEDAPADNPVPEIAPGTPITAASGRVLAKVTKTPARYKEGTLVKELERLGIGRPSTYAAILKNIIDRGYLAKDKRGFLTAQPAGHAVVDGLVSRCHFVDLDYTSELEDALDAVAAGKASYLPVVAAAHDKLVADLSKVTSDTPSHACPDCGQPLRRRAGKVPGSFWWGCTTYPACKATMDDTDGQPTPHKATPRPPTAAGAAAYFAVAFAEKDKAKGIGMRFDPACKRWYAPDATVAKAATKLFGAKLAAGVAAAAAKT